MTPEGGATIVARAPTRVDFGGGWTDVPPYGAEHGGFVCNLAIARHATVVLGGAAAGHALPAGGEHALARAALARAGLAAHPARLTSDFPVGAGLGGSSAAGVALVGACRAARGLALEDRAAIAEESRATEVEDLGVAGGFQDHYAAAFGGALGLTFTDVTRAQRIALAPETIAALERRMILCYTGQSRISGRTITGVLDAYRTRVPRVMRALARMAQLARGMAAALGAGDVHALGEMVAEHWLHQRALHAEITTPTIDRVLQAAQRAGALGGKALGASGGGCVLAIAREGNEEAVRAAVAGVCEVLEWRVDLEGLVVTKQR